jgi:AcrR family transcriptional regulator
VSQQTDLKRDGSTTRERILAVALELFASRGYSATSVRDITEHLGMTKASLYYHFASKEDILDALHVPWRDEIDALLAKARSGQLAGAAQVITEFVDITCRRASVLRAFMSDPSVLHRSRKENAMRQLDALVDILMGEDRTPAGHLAARCALGAVQSAVLWALSEDRFGPPTAEMAERILAGGLALLDDAEQRVVVAAALGALASTARLG